LRVDFRADNELNITDGLCSGVLSTHERPLSFTGRLLNNAPPDSTQNRILAWLTLNAQLRIFTLRNIGQLSLSLQVDRISSCVS